MDTYKTEWKRSAIRELEKLPRPMISKIVSAVDNLSSNPYPHGVRKLVSTENKLIIEIIRVGHRKDIYR
jgi:mRNA interferase RelE/StbE